MKDITAGSATLAIAGAAQIASHAEDIKPWLQDFGLIAGGALSCVMILYYCLKIRGIRKQKQPTRIEDLD